MPIIARIPVMSHATASSSSRMARSVRPTAALALRRPTRVSPFLLRSSELTSVAPVAENESKEVVLAPVVDEDGFEGLSPEEDVEVPGDYFSALNANTKLGKAVRSACDELEHLNTLELDVLNQCDQLLKKLGVKESIMQVDEDQLPEQEPGSE